MGAMAILAESRSDRRATVNLYKANGDPGPDRPVKPESIGRYLHCVRRTSNRGDRRERLDHPRWLPEPRVLHLEGPHQSATGELSIIRTSLAGGRELALFDGKTLRPFTRSRCREQAQRAGMPCPTALRGHVFSPVVSEAATTGPAEAIRCQVVRVPVHSTRAKPSAYRTILCEPDWRGSSQSRPKLIWVRSG